MRTGRAAVPPRPDAPVIRGTRSITAFDDSSVTIDFISKKRHISPLSSTSIDHCSRSFPE
ncbi:hypothetical protein GSH05_30010 [Burkholderia pseudomallei]|uniref:Uncharacterized protein n=1 Tax=Burkholderia pseudomallei TaxID=28450 RepID=A0AAX0U8L9_BURPE|nr:hypothetical protein BHT10_28465 [Burkholderia pseudomallei]PNW98291.1 hypothetical protein CF649_26165 [Burkholderia sp. 136(2017)]PNX11928.1 hypothetical protein CF650_27460 [Burkholderia sp. 129]PNX26364.1 hypothetical protein CF647_25800 [Burkholderia sp. 117]PNX34967.1 hypothetical protein CF648_26170 [Burkholderia sp. 137]